MTPSTFLGLTWYGNTVRAWLIALGVLIAGMAVLLTARRILTHRLSALASRTSTDLDDFAVDLLRHTHPLFLFLLVLGAALYTLHLPGLKTPIGLVVQAAFILQLAVWGNELIVFWVRRVGRAQAGAGGQTTFTAMTFVGRLVLWTLILILLLENFGLRVTTLVTGLGVSGIAVALAAQSVLGDLFAAMSIYLDKPFLIGDFIIFDDYMGSVEYVGLRSTRIKSLSGEQIIISNSDLLKTRIRNYKRMAERRVVFQIGVVENLPYDTVARIPGMIREAVQAQPNTRLDRTHFKEYGESSLNFETVYYVLSADYNVYMDIQQAINLALFRRFAEEGIGFAYPTRTVIMSDGRVPGVAGGDAGLALDPGLREEAKR